MQVNNLTIYNFINDATQQKQSKSFDMKLHWLRDRQNQNQFHICWDRGSNNLADYLTKHYAAAHYRQAQSTYLCSLVIGHFNS